MQAREIMTRDPRALTLDETITAAARIMRELDVGVIPIVEDAKDRRLRGVITDRDIAVRHVAEGHTQDCPVSEHMSDRLTTANPDDDMEQVLERMRREQVRRIPVVEDGGRLVGIIAQADVAVEIGPEDPKPVEKTLEEISKPAEPQR